MISDDERDAKHHAEYEKGVEPITRTEQAERSFLAGRKGMFPAAEVERLRRIIAKEVSENDELGAEFVYFAELRGLLRKERELNRLLANKNADCELRIGEAVKAERERICAEVSRSPYGIVYQAESYISHARLNEILSPTESEKSDG